MIQLNDETTAALDAAMERRRVAAALAAGVDAAQVSVTPLPGVVEPTMCIPRSWLPLLRETAEREVEGVLDHVHQHTTGTGDGTPLDLYLLQQAVRSAADIRGEQVPVASVLFLVDACIDWAGQVDDVRWPTTMDGWHEMHRRLEVLGELIEFRDRQASA